MFTPFHLLCLSLYNFLLSTASYLLLFFLGTMMVAERELWTFFACAGFCGPFKFFFFWREGEKNCGYVPGTRVLYSYTIIRYVRTLCTCTFTVNSFLQTRMSLPNKNVSVDVPPPHLSHFLSARKQHIFFRQSTHRFLVNPLLAFFLPLKKKFYVFLCWLKRLK